MKWLVLAGMALVAVARAEFVPPAEGPVPFRRDKLPVDVETIASLSRQITDLTGAPLPGDAAGLRAAAQMTGLALALDPANREARRLIENLLEGKGLQTGEEEDLERTRSRVRQLMGWLETPEAGADGRALAACLADILEIADPETNASEEPGEQGAWKDWIAPESAFRTKEPEVEPEQDPMEEEPVVPAIALEAPVTTAPLWTISNDPQKPALAMATIKGKVSAGSETGDIEIHWGTSKPGDLLVASSVHVGSALAKRHGGLPGGLVANFAWDGIEAYASDKNGAALSGTAAILLDSAITGKNTSSITLAVVGQDGTLSLPPGFWVTLRALSALKGHERIILPAQAENFLSTLLVLDDASFFLDHEVLIASSVDELCDLAAGTKPAVAESITAFEEIRKVGQGKTVGSFVAHPATQTRLNRLASSMPQHASARLLALQGSGGRPRFLHRTILAREIRDALQPINYLKTAQPSGLLTHRLDEIHNESRKKLDELFNIIEIRDRDLHKSAVAVADSVRTLARLLDKQDRVYTYDLRQKQTQAYSTAWAEYVKIMRTLTEAAGDANEFAAPQPLEER